jgi:hypothetical protein
MPVHQRAKEIVPKILYEVDMLEYACAKLADLNEKQPLHQPSSIDIPPDRLYTSNVLLECFLIHARNLYDFLTEDPQRDDVSALHFFDDPAPWQSARTTLCPYMRNEKTRLQGLLAHLTYRRLDYEQDGQKDWSFAQMLTELNEAWRRFQSSVTKICGGRVDHAANSRAWCSARSGTGAEVP